MDQRIFNDGEKQSVECQDDGFFDESLEIDQNLLTEDVLKKIKKTPVGRLLQKMASMPEVRQEKVLRVRREISKGSYNLNDRLDVAFDNILEELLV